MRSAKAKAQPRTFNLPKKQMQSAKKVDTKKTKNTDSPLEQLIHLETQALDAPDRRSLRHLIANNTRRIVSYGHCFIFIRNDYRDLKAKTWITKTISGQGIVDRTSPFIVWLENCVNRQLTQDKPKCASVEKLTQNNLPKMLTLESEGEDKDDLSYPYKYGLWINLAPDISLLFARPKKWRENDVHILSRLSRLYGNCWRALGSAAKISTKHPLRRRLFQAAGLVGLILLLWPISMTTLAPAEIIAAKPQILTAPINGVIKEIHFPPNTLVKEGDVIASYEDTALRNEYAVSAEETRIARARLDTSRRVSINDAQQKRGLKVLETELDLAKSRKNYAGDQLARTQLIAETQGLLVYSDANDWRGRPVTVGERIVTIANPNAIEVKIEAPVGDGELLNEGARVKLFLDAKPINSIKAKLRYAAFFAEPTPGGQLAYVAKADIIDDEIPRIGARGVAKIYGKRAPLGFWLMRKPIVSLRQFIGL